VFKKTEFYFLGSFVYFIIYFEELFVNYFTEIKNTDGYGIEELSYHEARKILRYLVNRKRFVD